MNGESLNQRKCEKMLKGNVGGMFVPKKFAESLIGGDAGPNGTVGHCYSAENASATRVRIPENARALTRVLDDRGLLMSYVATVRRDLAAEREKYNAGELIWCADWTVDPFVAAMLLSGDEPHRAEPLNTLRHYASAASRREAPPGVESTQERVIDTCWGPVEVLLENRNYARAVHAAEEALDHGCVSRMPAETADAVDRWHARLEGARRHVQANGFLTDGVMVVHGAPLGAFTRVRPEIWTPALKYSDWAITSSRGGESPVGSAYAIAGSRRLPTEYRQAAIETIRAILGALEGEKANQIPADRRQWIVTELLECVPASTSRLSLAQVHRVVRHVVGGASTLRVDVSALVERFEREEARTAPPSDVADANLSDCVPARSGAHVTREHFMTAFEELSDSDEVFLATATGESTARVDTSRIRMFAWPEWATHVVWYRDKPTPAPAETSS